MIPELRGKTYAQRLKDLDFFRYDNNNITRSNGQKLHNLRNRPSETEVAKNFFTNEVVGKWNGLPREVVNSTSIDSFKKKP